MNAQGSAEGRYWKRRMAFRFVVMLGAQLLAAFWFMDGD